MAEFDSRADTLEHIHRVRDGLGLFAGELLERGRVHDQSKLSEPEKSAFDRQLARVFQNTLDRWPSTGVARR